MIKKIILASKSEVRKKILIQNDIDCEVIPANVDEDEVKRSLLTQKATPKIISKNLAELKANKISQRRNDEIVLGADSVIDLKGELISKPTSREEALKILLKLNGTKHQLISSVCISKNGSMIWNFTDSSTLTMKKLNLDEIKSYLTKIRDKELYNYGVYQIESDGKTLFSKIEGDENTIMGLPVKQIKDYLKSYEVDKI
jgi:septum formation protein